VPYPEMENITATKLILIARKAREDTKLKFISLIHHLNPEYLLACYQDLRQGKAPGIDGRTKESYTEKEIKEKLGQTVELMKARKYRPQPVKRIYIEKENSKERRPLGLPTVIDRIIQLALKNILEAIYEPNFLDYSFGYRPNRDAHQALKAVNHLIMQKKINWIIDADIDNFFDNINHYWMMECLVQRIKDPRFKSLIFKFLKAGVMEEGKYERTEQGIPQGGIISPLLANIYLHYVLDLWFEKVAKKELNGEVQLIRYADDFIIGLQYQDQAEKLLEMLKQRLSKFGLTLSLTKTRIIEFGRFAKENCQKRGEGKPKTFGFLGFTHYCSKTRDGRFKLGIKTNGKRMRRNLKNMNSWIKSVRNLMKIKDIWELLKVKLQGHYNYYGISGNFPSVNYFYYKTILLVYKWLNRRSWKRSFNWESFNQYLNTYPLPKPKLMFQIYNTW
jgi:group II intron reverse transcriptase/maturase